jgi:hypothetical protein
MCPVTGHAITGIWNRITHHQLDPFPYHGKDFQNPVPVFQFRGDPVLT